MNGIVFPDIDPVIIAIGPVAIRWYALAYIAGILLGWYYIGHLLKRSPRALPKPAFDNIVTWAILGILLGGRLGYVLFYNPGYYFSHPADIVKVWHGGMSFHGGMLGMLVAMWRMSLRYKIALRPVLDLLACAAPIGLFFGRIANFINAELYGRPTTLPFGVIFPNSDGLARHPSQLYEATLEGLCLFILLHALVRRQRILRLPGLATGVFLLWYASARIVVELFREPDAHIGFLFGIFTMGQLLSLPLALVGLWFIRTALKTKRPVKGIRLKPSAKPVSNKSA